MADNAAVERTAVNGHKEIESAVVRFAGDSGDGMQLTGSQFTLATALAGNDLATFPDFPAEIRAPTGTTYGVSAFQINFGARNIMTAGDQVDVLVAMNPAALKTNIDELKPGGVIFVDAGAFSDKNLRKAGYVTNPLENGTVDKYRVVRIDMSRLTLEAVKEFGLSQKEALRSKNMWALGLVYWMYGRKRQATIEWLSNKFAGRPDIRSANIASLNAGHAFGETAEMPAEIGRYEVPSAEIAPGEYRTITGATGIAFGLIAGARFAGVDLTFCSYPITPASAVLHELAGLKEYDVVTFQAEDEIAAIGAAIGASYAGNIGVTSSSGPGIALKAEAMGLAIAAEIPLVIINSQRAGPSTGMPTKTEQSDLYQAVYGRNADSPLPVIAPRGVQDSFDMAIEAVRLATKYMTPVILLTDGYIANASEPWRIPDLASRPRFPVSFRTETDGFEPFMRDRKTLARPWVKPGTPGLEHRIGGLERAAGSGHVSYDAVNHQEMTDTRMAKIAGIAADIPMQEVDQGEMSGDLVIVGWGSTYGAINRSVAHLREDGLSVSHIHICYICPLPANLGDLLLGYGRVLVAELNTGQLRTMLRAEYLVPAEGLNKVTGKPFTIAEIEQAARGLLEA